MAVGNLSRGAASPHGWVSFDLFKFVRVFFVLLSSSSSSSFFFFGAPSPLFFCVCILCFGLRCYFVFWFAVLPKGLALFEKLFLGIACLLVLLVLLLLLPWILLRLLLRTICVLGVRTTFVRKTFAALHLLPRSRSAGPTRQVWSWHVLKLH